MAISPLSEWLPDWLLNSLTSSRGEVNIWLVGGAIRDRFLDRETFDYDFVVEGNARKTARTIANSLGANYFDLDSERDTGRVIFVDDTDQRFVLDFARRGGTSISDDLNRRDFTINSLAINLNSPQELIDPTKGLMDIKDGILRAASPRTFLDDPIRVLRAVRFVIMIEGRVEPETLKLLRGSQTELATISSERIRDEIFRIFALPQPIRALRLMDHLDLIAQAFPELEELKKPLQSAGQELNAWRHTLSVVDHLGKLMAVMSPVHDPEGASQLALGEYSLRLGRFRKEINEYLDNQLSYGRSLRQLLILSALYHELGELNGRKEIHHEMRSVKIIQERAQKLRLSKSEVRWLSAVIQGHLRPSKLARQPELTKRDVYRFLRDTGNAAPGILLLSLADVLTSGDPPIDQDIWGAHVKIVRELLSVYYTQKMDYVQREPILRGDEISSELGIQPGPEIGIIMRELLEGQAVGEINSRVEAISFAREILARINRGESVS